MANPFDQFDAAPAPAAPPPPPRGGNPFDVFDEPRGGSAPRSLTPRGDGIAREAFDARFEGDRSVPYRTSSDVGPNDSAYPDLYGPLRAKADERLVGPPSAANAAKIAVLNAGQEATLNLAGNAAALGATVAGAYDESRFPKAIEAITGFDTRIGGYPFRSFTENRQLLDDKRAALERQAPKSALAGTVAGIGVGAVALPPLSKVPAATMAGRAKQAAAAGGVYGAVAEGLDSFDPLRSAIAGGVGAVGGAVGSAAIEKAAPHVVAAANRAWPAISRVLGRGEPVATVQGGFTPQAQAALREIGVDPAGMPDELATLFSDAFRTKGASPAVAREAAASEFAIPLSRGQATQDVGTLSREREAISGTRGGKAQEIGQGFSARQGEALDTARTGLQTMAARGTSLIENPAAAAETVADRARLAASDNAFDVAAAQRAEDDARRLVRGRDGDALDHAASAATGVREAAGRSREGYRAAYADVRKVDGEFVPGAFERIGERIRNSVPRDMPVDPVVTPGAFRALADLDGMPSLLGGSTPADVETFRRRLRAYASAAGGNNTDRNTLRTIIDSFDDYLENAEAAGLFRPRQAGSGSAASATLPAPAAAPADDFPGFAAAGLPDPAGAPARAPETMGQFIARNGGLALTDDARAADLHRWQVGGVQRLARAGGRSMDDLRDPLVVAGFLRPDAADGSIARNIGDEVMEALRAERAGQPRYRFADEGRAENTRRLTDATADQNADYAAQLDRQVRRIALDMEEHGLRAADLDARALNDAAEIMLRREADDAATAYDLAVLRRGSGGAAPGGAAADDAPFPELGSGTTPAASSALPGGSTDLTTAMRRARGLFREHQQAFRPRGPGDDAGRLLARIVDTDMTPTEVASALFSSTTRPGERGLSVRVAARLREALGDDSPVLAAVQQGLLARVIDGNGAGDAGARVDNLLRGQGRAAAQAILTEPQRRALGAFRAALYQTERAQQALPSWISDLARKDFDPNAVASGLFGSGIPGERVGSANFGKALKGFLGEDSAEWSGLRQAAIANLLRPSGRALSPAQEAARITEFAVGKGAGLAKELFLASELAQLRRYGTVVRSTVLPSGIGAPNSGRARETAAHLMNGLLGALAVAKGVPTAAAAPFTTRAGQRVFVGGPNAFAASRSFNGGAPRAPLPGPVLDLRRLGTGTGLAAEYGLPAP